MKLNNGLHTSFFLFLLLTLFSFSANAICVPRNYSQFVSPAASLILSSPPPPQSPPQSPPQAPPQSPPQAPPQAPPQSPPQAPPQSPPQAPPQAPPQSPPQAPPQSPPQAPPQSPPQSPPPQTQSPPDTPASDEETSENEEQVTSGHTTFDTVGVPAAVTAEDLATTTAWAGTKPTNLGDICGTTDNPQLCTKSISTHLEPGSKKIDPVSALRTEIEESIKKVKNAVVKVRELRKDPSTSNTEIACLDTCLENYDLAIYDLQSGLESIENHDAGTMESVLTAVITNLGTCDDTFAEMGVDSPLDNVSLEMNKFASNCLAISKMLL